MNLLEGGCLCGAVRYVVEDRFQYAGYCHCSQCRKTSGSAFAAFAGIAADGFRLSTGADSVQTYRKSDDSLSCFCRVCGSNLFSRKPKSGMIHLRLGILNESASLLPSMHVFIGSKATWYKPSDDLVHFDTIPKAAGTISE